MDVRRIRVLSRLTQAQLAQMAGVCPSVVSDVENQNRSIRVRSLRQATREKVLKVARELERGLIEEQMGREA